LVSYIRELLTAFLVCSCATFLHVLITSQLTLNLVFQTAPNFQTAI